jgi:exodeoxyribonuclease V gamma subunit
LLHVHRSERADRLAEALGDLLAHPLGDPMTSEVVAVPTRGVERWLAQVLSNRLGARSAGGDGVCANVEFPFPGSLVTAATARACGLDPEHDPWSPERSVWPLLTLVDEHLEDDFLGPLRRHLQSISPSDAPLRRFATVRRIADLYDRYAVNRPEILHSWAAGNAGWGAGGDETEAWQAELWRRLRAKIAVPGPAERYALAAERLEAEPELLELPSRLSLFGLTRLPASHLQVLRSIAVGRDVHLFLLHPSPGLWAKVAEAHPPPSMRRADDSTDGLVRNPLLRSWGRDAREMQLVLSAQGIDVDDHRPVDEAPATLLGLLQADIRADRAPGTAAGAEDGGGEPPLLRGDDDSVQVHACHGRARQVEVLRDVVLHLLERDPTLEPRHVIVMCPDIEAFAPLVAAAFGASAPPGAAPAPASEGGFPPVRVRLADRSMRQTNPLLAVAARLLGLAASRASASEVLDLAAYEPVSRRFGFVDDGLAELGRWVADTGIRWGMDADRRAPWRLGGEPANTWRAGMDRLLLGAAMSAQDLRLVGGVLPFDDVPHAAVGLVGRLAEFIERLGAALEALSGRRSVAGWGEALVRATESLALAAPHETWQHDQLRSVLGDVVDEASSGATEVELGLAEVVDLLEDRLRGRPTRANFRTGDLTVCTLVPMRSVPHRVVCLLGLDDGVFPRQSIDDGDNLLLADPCVGERDSRSEDRQLLLDAVLAAQEHLVVTYEGHDLRTNQPRPPCVPLAELLDAVDRTVRVGGPGCRPRDRVVVAHPLQPFDERNFTPETLTGDGPFSFDAVHLQGARARCAARRKPPPFLSGLLDPPAAKVIPLDSLVRFVEHPVRAFLRQRLFLDPPSDLEDVVKDVVKDDIPVSLDGLEKWVVGDRLLQARLEGLSMEAACAAERARGVLPPGRLADEVLSEIKSEVEAVAGVAEQLVPADVVAESLPVDVALPQGRRLVGSVGGVRRGTIVRVLYSRLGPKHRLAAWARLVALAASSPGRPVGALTVGRGRAGGRPWVAVSRFDPLASDPAEAAARARELLEVLVDLYDRAMREPLPLYCATSAAWAEAACRDGDPRDAAARQWEDQDGPEGRKEADDPAHVLVLGGTVPFTAVVAEPPRPDEHGPGWAQHECTRFGRLALRLWGPVLDHERLERR